MKHLFLATAIAMAATLTASAQDTVKELYSGEPVEVTWANTLTIPASDFADGVNVGDYIYITFSQTTDVIELKADGKWLPGTRYTILGDNAADFKTYITADMLDNLKQYGMEICGAKFTVTNVSVCNDGFKMPEGAIWGGYFWVENWNTLELFKTAFDKYDGQQYMDIYLSDDNEAFDGYFMKVLTKWNPETIWANNDQITHTPRMATVDLANIDVAQSLADVNALMVQANPEGGRPFNITAIALRDKNGSSIDDITIADNATLSNIYNLQGTLVASGITAEEAMTTLPAGIYIADGKKFIVR